MKNRKECEGCDMYYYECSLEPSYTDPKTNKIIRCPCMNCIVKMICEDGSTCEEYKEYHCYKHILESKEVKIKGI